MNTKKYTFLTSFTLFKKPIYSLQLFPSCIVMAALMLGLSATVSLNVLAQTVSTPSFTTQPLPTQTLTTQTTIAQALNTQPLATNQSGPPITVLSIVQVCSKMARGGGCKLQFVPTQNQSTLAGNIHSTCAPGWLAYLSVEQGTVEQGGVNRGEAVVCGYADAASALKAVVRACNEQNLGMCTQANQIDAKWAFMSEKNDVLATLPLNQADDLRSFEQYQTCQSTVPVTSSKTCSTQASEAARLAGFK